MSRDHLWVFFMTSWDGFFGNDDISLRKRRSLFSRAWFRRLYLFLLLFFHFITPDIDIFILKGTILNDHVIHNDTLWCLSRSLWTLLLLLLDKLLQLLLLSLCQATYISDIIVARNLNNKHQKFLNVHIILVWILKLCIWGFLHSRGAPLTNHCVWLPLPTSASSNEVVDLRSFHFFDVVDC